ncbi:ISAzo13 family transposase [Bdellovibrionota bacterium FG-1]
MKEIRCLMDYETAGDPMSGLKWTRKTTEKISAQLLRLGLRVSKNTVGRLLKQMDFSLRVNHKKLSRGSKTTQVIRNEQFGTIRNFRDKFERNAHPVISVDTKKKELVGQFKNPGKTWRQTPELVNDHDFRSDGKGMAAPYGIYDTTSNRGFVCVGKSADTAEFAVDSIVSWWAHEGCKQYPDSRKLLILADAGGSNGCRTRAWKYQLQHKLCNIHGLTVNVSHYPPGASKWNPIEHRLFSEISKNWAGIPLSSFKTVLNYIRTTKTKTGLSVSARLIRRHYPKGVKITDAEMQKLRMDFHPNLPKWNYTIRPQKM